MGHKKRIVKRILAIILIGFLWSFFGFIISMILSGDVMDRWSWYIFGLPVKILVTTCRLVECDELHFLVFWLSSTIIAGLLIVLIYEAYKLVERID
ncbi:MAG: hypothetical protein HXS48_07065 [Theionarchaea archaeon]|nr:hypothetical protein [Theionarchaea archaeon]